MQDRILAAVAREVRVKHGCHTVILYGSYARGDATATSDVDLIGLRSHGPEIHDARKFRGAYLDAFIYPDKGLKASNFLRARDGIVLFQSGDAGDQLLAKIARVYRKGPKRLSVREGASRRTWIWKMLARAKRDDMEAHFRRAWLLFTLLEDYFALRGLWYEGPKASFAWLRNNDKAALRLFERALAPNARISAIEKLATRVAG